jgi:hypothetical protein
MKPLLAVSKLAHLYLPQSYNSIVMMTMMMMMMTLTMAQRQQYESQ